MPAGLQVFNDHNIYQIDGSNPNYVFLTKGSANNAVEINSPAVPMVFVRPSLGYGMRLRHNGGNSYTYFCTGYFEYWVFCKMMPSMAENFGLQVFNENGEMVYGSNRKPLKIAGMVEYTRTYEDRIAVPSHNLLPLSAQSGYDVTAPRSVPLALPAYSPGSFGSRYSTSGAERYPTSFQQGFLDEALVATPGGFAIKTVASPHYIITPTPAAPFWGWEYPRGVITYADVAGY